MKTQAETLASVVDSTRNLARFYLSKLKEHDPAREFECNGIRFNSVRWTIAHMTWAQNNLLLAGTGGKRLEITWEKDFKIGSDPSKVNYPEFSEILRTWKEVHANSISFIKTLSDDQLAEDNSIGFILQDGKSKAFIIEHHIRHEGFHIGHLGWLLKFYGIKSF